jgi:malonate-semialdehyde dehydrogenase (acetylating)/methylmalonate-semialdehyde dehydrogenase
MGPLVTKEHRDKVASYVDRGIEEGATLVVDGRQVEADGAADGFWLGPSLFDNVTTEMSIYKDEIFGPVLAVIRVPDLDAALEVLHGHPYGNGAAIFTSSGLAARRFEDEAQIGMIGVNVPVPVPVAYYSFGGWKQSLFGDTHAHGVEGVHFFTRGKVITTRWPVSTEATLALSFPQNR